MNDMSMQVKLMAALGSGLERARHTLRDIARGRQGKVRRAGHLRGQPLGNRRLGPVRPGPRHRDLDLASYGAVAVLDHARGTTYPDMAWEPKQVFGALATAYAHARP